MKICLKVAFLCTAFSLCSHIGAADNSAELIKAGDKLVSGKKFGEGIVRYHSALKQGENPEVCYKLGIAYSRLNEDAAAAHYFRSHSGGGPFAEIRKSDRKANSFQRKYPC